MKPNNNSSNTNNSQTLPFCSSSFYILPGYLDCQFSLSCLLPWLPLRLPVSLVVFPFRCHLSITFPQLLIPPPNRCCHLSFPTLQLVKNGQNSSKLMKAPTGPDQNFLTRPRVKSFQPLVAMFLFPWVLRVVVVLLPALFPLSFVPTPLLL